MAITVDKSMVNPIYTDIGQDLVQTDLAYEATVEARPALFETWGWVKTYDEYTSMRIEYWI